MKKLFLSTFLLGIIFSVYSQTVNLTKNPYADVNWSTYNQYKANYHTHTTNSDGSQSPSTVINEYYSKGYSILSITDHNYTTWAWPSNPGMLAIRGNEYSSSHHMNAFINFTTTSSNLENGIPHVQSSGGLAMINHPGRYNSATNWSWYIPWFRDYSSCVALEVFNQGDRYPNDRQLWDNINENLFTQTGKLAWGTANDDKHTTSHLYGGFNFMLMPNLTEASWRECMTNGAFYFCSEPGKSGNANVPIINNITVDNNNKTITINATGYTTIQWIGPGSAVVATGNVFDYSAYTNQAFVRVVLDGPGGDSYTQPFGFETTTVTTPPVANFTANPTIIDAGQSVSFTDQTSNSPTSWSWSFNGGTPSSSTLQNPTITYNTAGTYSVTLTATNAAGNDVETKTNYITVNAVPTYTLTTSAVNGTVDPSGTTTHNQGVTVTVTATPSPGYAFTGWSGDVTSTVNPLSVVMNSNKNIVANFTESVCANYCASAGASATDEWISKVDIGTFTNSSAGQGYTDFTSQVIDMNQGEAYPITLTPGFAGTAYAEYWSIWVDLNKDCDFDDPGEKVFDAGATSTTAVTGNITIPTTSATGITAMRISMKYNAASTQCENTFQYGEVEDYMVNIIPGSTVTYTLSPNVVGQGSIILDPPTGPYNEGTIVTATATPNQGYQFDGWSGDLTGSTNPAMITMNSNKTITATFSVMQLQNPVTEANGPYNGTINNPITFSSTGSVDPDGNIVSYAWDFGDGTTSTQANPSHTYTTVGNYDITLTVTDNDGLTGSDNAVATITDTPQDYALLPYSTGFESGALDQYWETKSDNTLGRIVVGTAQSPRTGSYQLLMDVSSSGTYVTNEAWLKLNLAGESQVDFKVWWKESGDEDHTQDGIYLSDNAGATFVKVYNLTGGTTTHQEISLDLDALASANGLSLSSQFVVKLQQHDNYPFTSDGFGFDDISVTTPEPQAPTAVANGPYSGQPGSQICFSSAGSADPDGNIVAYLWDFGDGTTSTEANPCYTYTLSGTYNASLIVTDNSGLQSAASTTTVTISDQTCTGIQACDGAISMTLVTDNYGSETSWTLKNSAGTTIESGSGYANNTTYNLNWNLTPDSYTFTINDSYGDGICCSYGNGSYTIADGCAATLQTGGSFTSTESFVFCVPGTPALKSSIASNENQKLHNNWKDVKVFPNPVNYGKINVVIPGKVSANEYIQLSTFSGSILKRFKAQEGKQEIKLDGIAVGIYLISIPSDGRMVTKRIVIEE